MIDKLQQKDFESLVNQKFEILPEDAEKPVEVELVEVTGKETEHTTAFSLLFKGNHDSVFGQKIHKVKHASLGEFDLFLGPIMHEKQDGQYYQAVFNRLKEEK